MYMKVVIDFKCICVRACKGRRNEVS